MHARSRKSTRRVLSLAGLCVVFFAFAYAGCQDATQLRLVVTTDIPCDIFGSIAISVGDSLAAAEAKARTLGNLARTSDCRNGAVGDIYITPGASLAGAVIVRASLRGSDPANCLPPNYVGCVVAKRVFAFEPHQLVELPVPLFSSCLDVPCVNEGLKEGRPFTCIDGALCTDAETNCSEGSKCVLGGKVVAPPKDAGTNPEDVGTCVVATEVPCDFGNKDGFCQEDERCYMDAKSAYCGSAPSHVGELSAVRMWPRDAITAFRMRNSQ